MLGKIKHSMFIFLESPGFFVRKFKIVDVREQWKNSTQ